MLARSGSAWVLFATSVARRRTIDPAHDDLRNRDAVGLGDGDDGRLLTDRGVALSQRTPRLQGCQAARTVAGVDDQLREGAGPQGSSRCELGMQVTLHEVAGVQFEEVESASVAQQEQA